MSTHGHDPEAAVASPGPGRQGGATPLHRPARHRAGQGHPDRPLRRAARGRSRLLRGRDGHGPAPHARRRRPGGLRRLRDPPRPRHLRVVPWQPEVAWCLGEAWRLDGSDHWPSCPRALLARVVGRYATDGLLPSRRAELEWFLCERDPTAPGGIRRYVDELSRVYTVGAISDPRQINLKMLLWADELGLKAFAGNHEFMNSQYEINVKHSGALDAADQGLHAQGGGEGDRGDGGLVATFMGRPFTDQGGSGFHLHSRSPTATAATRSRRRRRRSARSHCGSSAASSSTRRAAGAARAHRQRVQADPPRQPRPDARQLGPRQPHRVLSRAERAGSRTRVEVRTATGLRTRT